MIAERGNVPQQSSLPSDQNRSIVLLHFLGKEIKMAKDLQKELPQQGEGKQAYAAKVQAEPKIVPKVSFY